MKVLIGIPEMKAAVLALKARGKTIGLIPTMGFLHEGHLSLVRESRRRCDATVVSIFVNPVQFGPKEDFVRYPKDFERDRAMLADEGADILFYPDAGAMYPEGYKTYVEVIDFQERLCGKSRPGHFRGVCTVVLKLFNIVLPDLAFFGQKDAQQAIILKKMAGDLNLDVKIEAMPIVREADGLAMSSRNIYLSAEERKAAPILFSSLREARSIFEKGERRAGILIGRMKAFIAAEPLARLDYVEIVNPRTLAPLEEINEEALMAMAVFVGETRLIDNIVVGGERKD
jgi:pantoate--beta-alanine ligase